MLSILQYLYSLYVVTNTKTDTNMMTSTDIITKKKDSTYKTGIACSGVTWMVGGAKGMKTEEEIYVIKRVLLSIK